MLGMLQVDFRFAGNKRKFVAPASMPFADIPISDANVQPLQPSRQQPGKQVTSDAQQALQPSTRQKKKPRVAFGRRVGVAPPRKPQDADAAADFQDSRQAAADASAVAPKQLQHNAVTAGTSASRLEAIVQASRAIPVSSRHAPAASARPHGRQAPAAAAESVLQDVTHAGEGMLHASSTLPACVLAAPSLATAQAQAQQVEGSKGRLEMAATANHTWKAPYNHAVYADEDFRHSPASEADTCTALHPTTTMSMAATTPHDCTSPAVLVAPNSRLRPGTDLPDAVRCSDTGLQTQYDTLLTDLAAQQRQSQLSKVRHSRLWDQQPPVATPMAAHCAQAVSTTANVPCRVSCTQSEQLEALTTDATNSPVPATATRFEHSASHVVVLPDDPFHQQLPQHLHELSKLSQHMPQHSADRRHAHNTSLQKAASQSAHEAAVSYAAPAQDVHSTAPLPSMPQQHRAQSQDQLRPEPEPSGQSAESDLHSPTASLALPGAASHAAALSNPANTMDNQAQGHQGTSGNARQPPDKKLLRASLAEWLADAVASKLWSAFETQRQASSATGVQEPAGSASSTLLPGG